MKVSAIGSGRWGKILLSKFHALSGLHLVYGHQNREALQTDFGLEFTEDIDQLIAESDVVVVATPPPTHFELTKSLLLAGKDVFTEKPITLSTEEAKELAESADKQGRILMVGHVLCYSTAYQKMLELPGNPVSATAAFMKTDTTEKELNAYWNFGIHMAALAVALGVEVDQFELDASDTAAENRRVFDLTKQTEGGKRQSLSWDFLAPENKEDMLMTECEHFLECVRTRQRPRTDGWHATQVTEMMLQISPEYRK